MRRSQAALPLGLAWLLGLAGAFLRGWDWSAGYDTQTKLFSPGVRTWLLCALAVLAALLLVLLCRRLPGKAGLSGRTGQGYPGMNTAAAAALAAAGAVGLIQQFSSYKKNGVAIAAFVLCFFAAAAVIAAARQTAAGARSPRFPMLLMLPSLCTLLWLIARYQEFAREPVLLIYMWRLLALAAGVLAVYFMVSLSLGKAGAARVGAANLIAVFLTLITLGEAPFLGVRYEAVPLLMDVFFLLYLSGQAWLVLREEPDPDQYPIPPKEEPENE